MENEINETILINVNGKVQGVGFRFFTRKAAKQAGGITGYVKNLPDRSVEILAQSDTTKLSAFIELIKQGF